MAGFQVIMYGRFWVFTEDPRACGARTAHITGRAFDGSIENNGAFSDSLRCRRTPARRHFPIADLTFHGEGFLPQAARHSARRGAGLLTTGWACSFGSPND
jgi:hypothetical protein